MRIRPAGSFLTIQESMERVVEVKSLQELKEHILDVYGGTFNIDTLKCRFYCDDERIGWHTYLITADYANGAYKQQAVVFADSPMEDLPTVVVSGIATYDPPKRRFFIVKETDKGTEYLDTDLKWKPTPFNSLDDCKIYNCTLLEAREQAFKSLALVTDPTEKPKIYPVELISSADGKETFFRPLNS